MSPAWLALTLWCVAADPVPAAEAPQTLLYVHTDPAGAEIQLEGKVLGRSDGLFPVEPGDHKIVLKLDGFQAEEKAITVAADRVTRLQVTLKASATAPVVEGVGWGAFRVGATRDEIVKIAGEAESNADPKVQWVRWTSRHHVDCLFDPRGGAMEVRFNRGFPGALASGIKIGSSEKDVLAAYGMPDRVVRNPQAKMVEYAGRGVLMWLTKGKVSDFTVFPPSKAAESSDSANSPGVRVPGYKPQGSPIPPALPQPLTEAVPEAGNLLKNSACETGDQTPEAWQQGAAIPGVRYLWDRSTAFQGKASLCLEKTVQRYFPIAQWFQIVDHSGERSTLVVSVQVKAQKMTKAILDVVFLDENEKWISHQWVAYIGAQQEGDPPAEHDWKLYAGKVTIPEGTKRIQIGLQDYGPGKVWFDDIRAGYAP